MRFEKTEPHRGKTDWEPLVTMLRAGETVFVQDVNQNSLQSALRYRGLRPHISVSGDGFKVWIDV